MKPNRWERLFDKCPGAWFGNPDPAANAGTGNITVDPAHTAAALAYLRRHRVEIVETRLHEQFHGLLIVYRPAAAPR